jgi:hypothetical protein
MSLLKKVTLGLALGCGLGLAAGAAGSAHAAVVATQGFADIGTPKANGSATGNINTATTFMIGDLISTTANTGSLSLLPTQIIGPVTFDSTNPTSLSFNSAAFGTFTSTAITESVNTPGVVSFYVLGDWSPGTYGAIASGSYLSSFTISFNQTSLGSISDSATFSVPPATTVPETSTLVMMLAGFAVIGLIGGRAIKPAGAALA